MVLKAECSSDTGIDAAETEHMAESTIDVMRDIGVPLGQDGLPVIFSWSNGVEKS